MDTTDDNPCPAYQPFLIFFVFFYCLICCPSDVLNWKRFACPGFEEHDLTTKRHPASATTPPQFQHPNHRDHKTYDLVPGSLARLFPTFFCFPTLCRLGFGSCVVICVFIGISLAYRFQLRILADKARWWQIQEILLTLSVTNVKKAGREDYHTSVQHGLKPDLCCVCVCATSHEISTSIPLYQH